MPKASRISRIMSTCGVRSSGTSSMSGWPCGSSTATRCALYDGIKSTRHCGRQSSSRHTTSRDGCSRVISVATASTGRPSGALIDEGTPKYERNHMLAPSRSNKDMPVILPGVVDRLGGYPNGMPQVQVFADVHRSAESMWLELGSFQSIARWHPMVTTAEGEGEEPGAKRTLET